MMRLSTAEYSWPEPGATMDCTFLADHSVFDSWTNATNHSFPSEEMPQISAPFTDSDTEQSPKTIAYNPEYAMGREQNSYHDVENPCALLFTDTHLQNSDTWSSEVRYFRTDLDYQNECHASGLKDHSYNHERGTYVDSSSVDLMTLGNADADQNIDCSWQVFENNNLGELMGITSNCQDPSCTGSCTRSDQWSTSTSEQIHNIFSSYDSSSVSRVESREFGPPTSGTYSSDPHTRYPNIERYNGALTNNYWYQNDGSVRVPQSVHQRTSFYSCDKYLSPNEKYVSDAQTFSSDEHSSQRTDPEDSPVGVSVKDPKHSKVTCDGISPSSIDPVVAAATAALANFHHRGSLQLWQFLVALLDDSKSQHLICWTGRTLEFKLNEPEEVARLWGIQKNRPAMNYDKLSRSLRYYYEKGIMQKVSGERYVYRFVYEPKLLFALAFPGEDQQTARIFPTSNAMLDPIKDMNRINEYTVGSGHICKILNDSDFRCTEETTPSKRSSERMCCPAAELTFEDSESRRLDPPLRGPVVYIPSSINHTLPGTSLVISTTCASNSAFACVTTVCSATSSQPYTSLATVCEGQQVRPVGHGTCCFSPECRGHFSSPSRMVCDTVFALRTGEPQKKPDESITYPSGENVSTVLTPRFRRQVDVNAIQLGPESTTECSASQLLGYWSTVDNISMGEPSWTDPLDMAPTVSSSCSDDITKSNTDMRGPYSMFVSDDHNFYSQSISHCQNPKTHESLEFRSYECGYEYSASAVRGSHQNQVA